MQIDAKTPVLIAGAGPVGMTLALTLASFGIRSKIVERNPSTSRHPKMDLTNGRSMELFKRIGVLESVRAAGVPESHPFDSVWASHGLPGVGTELHRYSYPSAHERRLIDRQLNDGTRTSEPSMRVSQIVLEPILRKHLDSSPFVDLRYDSEFLSFREDALGVISTISTPSGNTEIRSSYLVGCDGGGSKIRKFLGIELEGTRSVAKAYLVHLCSKARDVLQPNGFWYHWQTSAGSMVAQNDDDMWTLHTPLPEGLEDGTSLDPYQVVRDWAGIDFAFKVLVANSWTIRSLIATHYRKGRIFLAGDSAHQVIPTGGYGMNTGIGDAYDLGWKLSANLAGWGGKRLLDSYEAERRPIAIRNREASERHAGVRGQKVQYLKTKLRRDGTDTAADLEQAGQQLKIFGNVENESWGIEHGYRYTNSPVVATSSSPPIPYIDDPTQCIPNTLPGSRLPHFWVSDDKSIHDQLGPCFSLLAFDASLTEPFKSAARELRTNLAVVIVDDNASRHFLQAPLTLVRPDHHIAWRGDPVGSDALPILRTIIGKGK